MSFEGKTKCLSFVVPRRHVKSFKTYLEKQRKLSVKSKIRPADHLPVGSCFVLDSSFYIKNDNVDDVRREAEELIRVFGHESEIHYIISELPSLSRPPTAPDLTRLGSIAQDWHMKDAVLDESILDGLTQNAPKTYSLYGSLLLLPASSSGTEAWHTTLETLTPDLRESFLSHMASVFKVTNIAINAPIPLHEAGETGTSKENLLRSPSHLLPLYGDFGPVCDSPEPSGHDFDAAYWTTTKQNGIYQSWAPRYTMFSRGNISEKARVLSLPSVAAAVQEGREIGRGSCAVDLYTGIGYFTFSYMAAGIDMVLGWDLNAWSIEGLRRGANLNKWKILVLDSDDEHDLAASRVRSSRIVAFRESNEYAVRRVEALRRESYVPPIRHVNLGLLPSSQDSWESAVYLLDRELGGWLHVHMNFATDEIEAKSQWIANELAGFVSKQSWPAGTEITVEHTERVKTYAPGVWHVVVDIWIGKKLVTATDMGQ